MKVRLLLKASLLMGLIVIGRFARDAEEAHPGQALTIDQLLHASAAPAPRVAVRPQPVAPAPLLRTRHIMAPPSQAASVAELY